MVDARSKCSKYSDSAIDGGHGRLHWRRTKYWYSVLVTATTPASACDYLAATIRRSVRYWVQFFNL
jgi:hypothetical protein